MVELVIGLVVGLLLGAILTAVYFALKAGGSSWLNLVCQIGKKASLDETVAKKVREILTPPPPPKPSGESVRLLAMLQRDSRLIDFLMENLQPFSDDQIGASVREIQSKAQATLKKHIVLESVFTESEGSRITIPKGFDPASVQLVGNVTGQPPFHGTLQHSGWRAKTVDLPKVPEGQDPFILMPAEVEIA